MKQEAFGMRRANGDWFALEVAGQSRVLEFPPNSKTQWLDERTSQEPQVGPVTQGGEPIYEVRNRLPL